MDAMELKPHEIEAVEFLKKGREKLLKEIRKVIIGQGEVIDQILIAFFSRGHCLLVGVPGLAKTLLISTIAQILDLKFNRIQFTPDLMPSDITGTDILAEDKADGKRVLVVTIPWIGWYDIYFELTEEEYGWVKEAPSALAALAEKMATDKGSVFFKKRLLL